ncbi:MAG: hypothetical protein S4CHLAM6_08260 [Chlamydiae bacterium]|nr:hypothetical protein [Chlamydiota bacterium]
MFSIFLLLVHITFSLYLFGVIWFVQLVHYPIFLFLNYDSNHNPFVFHQARSSIVVLPAMALELVSIVVLMFIPYPNYIIVTTLLVFTLLIWLATFTMQVPCHKVLKAEKDEKVIRRLIWTNWLRTGLWTLKAVYIFFLLWNLLNDALIVIS